MIPHFPIAYRYYRAVKVQRLAVLPITLEIKYEYVIIYRYIIYNIVVILFYKLQIFFFFNRVHQCTIINYPTD